MNPVPIPSRPQPRGRAPIAWPDPADMGTVVGLEMTLAAAATPSISPRAIARPWWQRLAIRRR